MITMHARDGTLASRAVSLREIAVQDPATLS